MGAFATVENVLGNEQEPKNVTLDVSKCKQVKKAPQRTADITNTNLQSGSLKVANGLIFGASDAEDYNSGADSHLGLIPVLVHVARRRLRGKAT